MKSWSYWSYLDLFRFSRLLVCFGEKHFELAFIFASCKFQVRIPTIKRISRRCYNKVRLEDATIRCYNELWRNFSRQSMAFRLIKTDIRLGKIIIRLRKKWRAWSKESLPDSSIRPSTQGLLAWAYLRMPHYELPGAHQGPIRTRVSQGKSRSVVNLP